MMARILLITLTILTVWAQDLAGQEMRDISPLEWNYSKATYNKTYSDFFIERDALTSYSYNENLIVQHNIKYVTNLVGYKLDINQFTDIPYTQFDYIYSVATNLRTSNEKAPPVVRPAPPSYDPRHKGIQLNIENQGTNCNSGWAYAAAKSIELFKASVMGYTNSPSLSAQNLIDCAGQANACYNQTPQVAFDYLAAYKMSLHFEEDYKNDINSKQGNMCTPPPNAQQLPAVNLNAFSKIKDGDDESIKASVAAGMPVVVEINPTSFEFMHYAKGIFVEPLTCTNGSHFMVIIGYDTDHSTNTDYWLLQNSFGTKWGIGGLMKLKRFPNITIFKNAIFPSEL